MTPRLHRRGSAVRGISTGVLLACLCNPGGAWAQAVAAPAQEGEALRNAIAGPLVVALSEQFGGRDVDMYLDRLATMPLGDGASMVSGTGAVRIQGQAGRESSFSFRLPWNTHLQQAGYPEVSVAGTPAGDRPVPNDVALVQQLEADVTAALAHHARQSAVSVRLDRVATVEGGTRFLRMQAGGVAYFSDNGAGTALTISALYDRSRRTWKRLEYGLGDEASTFVAH